MLMLAKVIDERSFGAMSYAQSIAGMLVFLVTLGFDSIVIKEIVQNKTQSVKILINVFYVRVIMLCVLLLIIYVYSNSLINDELVKSLVLFQSLTLGYYVLFTFSLHFQALVKNVLVTKARVFISLISLLVKLYLITLKVDVLFYIIVDVVSMTVQGGLIVFLYVNEISFKKLKKENFQLDHKLITSLFKQSWPLMLTSASILIYARVDQFMLGSMVSIEELARYSIAVKLSESWYFIPSVISLVLFPLLVSKKSDNEKEYQNVLGELTFVTFWVAVLCSLLVILFVTPLVSFIFNGKYQGFSIPVYILSITGVFVTLGFSNGRWLICEELTKIELLRCAIGAVVNISLNYIFIPLWGMYGAAISTLISLSISSYLILYLIPSTRWVFYFQLKSVFSLHIYKVQKVRILNLFKKLYLAIT